MKINRDFELQNVCGEHILIAAGDESIDFNRIISFNPTLAFLWEKLATADDFTIEDMAALLCSEYEIEEEIAREDCELIVEEWIKMGIAER